MSPYCPLELLKQAEAAGFEIKDNDEKRRLLLDWYVAIGHRPAPYQLAKLRLFVIRHAKEELDFLAALTKGVQTISQQKWGSTAAGRVRNLGYTAGGVIGFCGIVTQNGCALVGGLVVIALAEICRRSLDRRFTENDLVWNALTSFQEEIEQTESFIVNQSVESLGIEWATLRLPHMQLPHLVVASRLLSTGEPELLVVVNPIEPG